MKSDSTVRRQLERVKDELKDTPTGSPDAEALYGAMTALSWALGQDTMAPAKVFTHGRKWHYEDGREVALTAGGQGGDDNER